MRKASTSGSSSAQRKMRPALTPEARENQMISLAVDLAERQLMEGTASSQVITHYLKLGSTREKLEQELKIEEIKLQRAKTESIKASEQNVKIFEEAVEAFKGYRGEVDDKDDH